MEFGTRVQFRYLRVRFLEKPTMQACQEIAEMKRKLVQNEARILINWSNFWKLMKKTGKKIQNYVPKLFSPKPACDAMGHPPPPHPIEKEYHIARVNEVDCYLLDNSYIGNPATLRPPPPPSLPLPNSFLSPRWWLCTHGLTLVQSLNSPFFRPHIGLGAEPGRAKEESRITCMRMPRTNQSKITRFQPRSSRQCVAQCLFQLAL